MMRVASVLVREISGSLLMMFFTLVMGSWQLWRDDALPPAGASSEEQKNISCYQNLARDIFQSVAGKGTRFGSFLTSISLLGLLTRL